MLGRENTDVDSARPAKKKGGDGIPSVRGGRGLA